MMSAHIRLISFREARRKDLPDFVGFIPTLKTALADQETDVTA
jgi:hypothetical protein